MRNDPSSCQYTPLSMILICGVEISGLGQVNETRTSVPVNLTCAPTCWLNAAWINVNSKKKKAARQRASMYYAVLSINNTAYVRQHYFLAALIFTCVLTSVQFNPNPSCAKLLLELRLRLCWLKVSVSLRMTCCSTCNGMDHKITYLHDRWLVERVGSSLCTALHLMPLPSMMQQYLNYSHLSLLQQFIQS